VTAGINVEGSSTGATLANNVSVDNGVNSPSIHVRRRISRRGDVPADLLDVASYIHGIRQFHRSGHGYRHREPSGERVHEGSGQEKIATTGEP
jgi:hypothetical protein